MGRIDSLKNFSLTKKQAIVEDCCKDLLYFLFESFFKILNEECTIQLHSFLIFSHFD
jgi:hypothetical protein